MVKMFLENFMWILTLGVTLVLCTAISSKAEIIAIEFDAARIEAEIAAAVAAGDDPLVAAKSAVANAIQGIVTANPNYPGGHNTLKTTIIEELTKLQITGLDDTDILASANHVFGIETDPDLEAYAASRAKNRAKARTQDDQKYGPDAKPEPGSPI